METKTLVELMTVLPTPIIQMMHFYYILHKELVSVKHEKNHHPSTLVTKGSTMHFCFHVSSIF